MVPHETAPAVAETEDGEARLGGDGTGGGADEARRTSELMLGMISRKMIRQFPRRRTWPR